MGAARCIIFMLDYTASAEVYCIYLAHGSGSVRPKIRFQIQIQFGEFQEGGRRLEGNISVTAFSFSAGAGMELGM